MTPASAQALLSIDLTCADIDRSAVFYEALGFTPIERGPVADPVWHALRGTTGRTAERLVLRLGEQSVTLLQFDPPGRPYPAGSTSSDLWFQHMALVVSDMAAAYAQVQALRAAPISRAGPEHLPRSTGGVRAYKLRDPDEHPLELLFFPPGTGDTRWHGPDPALFQGIDHSAIAVRDAAAARRFYTGMLGLATSGATVNHGPAQERLDDLDADVVDVVPLSPPVPTPHVELLGYRVGRRRPIPADTGPADIAVTWLTFRANHLDDLDPRGRPQRRGRLADGHAAVALSDHDGHRLMLVGDR